MKKILVIQNKRIGDVLLASVIAENLKLIHPESSIDYMVYDYTADVIKNHKNIDTVIEINEKKLKKISNLIKTAFKIKSHKYDLIIDPYAKFQSRFICFISKAPVRIGYIKRDKKPFFNFYTHYIPFLKKSTKPCGKSIEDRVNLINAVYPIKTPIYTPKIFLKEDEKAYNVLNSYNKPVIMVGVMGSNPKKSMPYSHIVDLINFITTNYDVYVLFNYAPYQKKDAETIYNMCQQKSHIIFDIYESSIRGFIKLMNKCDLLIANEGGAVHMAKSLNKPTFTIYSPYILRESWASFEDGKNHTSVHLIDFKPELLEVKDKASRRKIEKDPSYLYKELSPKFIIPKLEAFLKNHI